MQILKVKNIFKIQISLQQKQKINSTRIKRFQDLITYFRGIILCANVCVVAIYSSLELNKFAFNCI